jgi:methylglyoxal synthase
MELQKTILNQYMLLNQGPTLKKIAADTGIQLTRVFRLFNGSTMKLSEYQIFQRKVKEMMGLTDTLEEMAFECSLKLSTEAVKDIEIFLKRKIEIWKIKQAATEKNKTVTQISA